MSRRAASAVFAALLVAGCGDSAAKPVAPAPDVKGAPLKREAPTTPESAPAPATDAPQLGDVAGATPAAPQPAPTPPAAKAPSPPAAADDFKTVTFDELAGFDYALYAEDAKNPHEVPAKIQALAGKRVAVDGYMMPLQYEAGGAKKFILMKNQFGCCYAATPKLNEWVEVTMEGGSVAEYQPHVLVTAWGVLDVKPQARDGMATGLYQMKGSKVEFTEAK